jgi:putative MATE family efflux protein
MGVEAKSQLNGAISVDVPHPPEMTPELRRLLEGPVLPTLLRLAAPTVALMLLQAVLAAGETALVGRLGSAALAGVSLSFPLIMLMSTLAVGAYGGGVAAGVARFLGAGKPRDAVGLAGTSLTLAALFGVGFTAMMLACGRLFYTWLGARGQALELAIRYSDLYFLGAVPYWVFSAAVSILRASGNTAYPAAASSIGSVITLSISPMLIWGIGPWDGFGLSGAAGAAVGYCVVMMLVLLRALRSGRSAVRPDLASLVPRWRYIAEILRISVPSAGNSLMSNLNFVILTGLVAPFGEAATAGYGAGGRLEYLLIPIVFGVGSALVPLVAASDGAGDLARIRGFTRAGAGLGAAACGAVGTLVACFPNAWMALFTPDPAVRGVGEAYLIRVGPAYAFLGLGLGLYFAAQGRGRVVPPLLAGFTRLLVAGIGGSVAVGLFGCGCDFVFMMMSVGLVAYGSIMVVVMRRELGLSGAPS